MPPMQCMGTTSGYLFWKVKTLLLYTLPSDAVPWTYQYTRAPERIAPFQFEDDSLHEVPLPVYMV